MNSVAVSLASYVVNAVWQVPVFCVAGWILSSLVRRGGPGVQHRLWVAILLLATLVPAVSMFRSRSREVASKTAVPFIAAVPPVPSGSEALPYNLRIALSPEIARALAGAYGFILLFAALRLGWGIRSTAALVRQAEPVSEQPEWAELWRTSRETFSVGATMLLHSPSASAPAAAGFLRPVLLLPHSFVEHCSREEFLVAVGHECAHIQRNDFQKNLFYEIISLFTIFHPATWFIKAQISETREMICDQMAADRLLNRRTYALSLLTLASRIPREVRYAASHAIGMFDSSHLERRIMTLTTLKPSISRLRHIGTGLTATLLLLICAAASWSLAQPVVTQPPSAPEAILSRLGREDLTCTYYGNDKDNKFGPHPGTCWLDEEEAAAYRCYLNENPLRSNRQSACEWKVQRALKANK